ncbi:cell division protein FtsQ/DivIB [Effusibacillus dendaii]|uniref:cell division protein FtsQ/DivIB n=1 Tax=Effusibacillus dendaii TaxID=2743772 RepID=UPI00190A3E55|nr:FtsQ-type POTRA domain-containing protein [Effusibacillus dendaii]
MAEEKRKPRRKALILLVIFFLGIAVSVFFKSPLSKVRSVQVTGNSQVSADEILKASAVQIGMNWWQVKADQIDKQVESQIPLIQKADVAVKFPGNVVIAVAEKSVAAVLIHQGVYYRLLTDGTVYDKMKSLTGTSLPLLVSDRSFPVEIGKQIPDADVQKFCQQVVNINRTLLDQFSYFQIQNGNLWSAWTVDDFEIRYPPGDLSTTLSIYDKFWKQQLAKDNKPPGIIYIYGADEAWYEKRASAPAKKE